MTRSLSAVIVLSIFTGNQNGRMFRKTARTHHWYAAYQLARRIEKQLSFRRKELHRFWSA